MKTAVQIAAVVGITLIVVALVFRVRPVRQAVVGNLAAAA